MYTVSAKISFRVRKTNCDFSELASLDKWMNEIIGAAHADVRRRLQEHGFTIETEGVKISIPEN